MKSLTFDLGLRDFITAFNLCGIIFLPENYYFCDGNEIKGGLILTYNINVCYCGYYVDPDE